MNTETPTYGCISRPPRNPWKPTCYRHVENHVPGVARSAPQHTVNADGIAVGTMSWDRIKAGTMSLDKIKSVNLSSGAHSEARGFDEGVKVRDDVMDSSVLRCLPAHVEADSRGKSAEHARGRAAGSVAVHVRHAGLVLTVLLTVLAMVWLWTSDVSHMGWNVLAVLWLCYAPLLGYLIIGGE